MVHGLMTAALVSLSIGMFFYGIGLTIDGIKQIRNAFRRKK
jgi:hypothetical protein